MGKSTSEELRNRGFINQEETDSYKYLTEEELVKLLESSEACERTAAVRLLSSTKNDEDSINLLCRKLSVEKKLYTKIEICEALKRSKASAVPIMLGFIGKIGNNQYGDIPEKDFSKKSYPLPRDIITRTLAHMGKEVLPYLKIALKSEDIFVVREIIDAIGFICFYDETDDAMNDLLICLNEKGIDNIVRWKIVRALESFNCTKVNDILLSIANGDSDEKIRREAVRSLRIIRNRVRS